MPNKVWLAYLDDNNTKTQGYFEWVGETSNFIIVNSGRNTLRIPSHRVLKIKHEKEQTSLIKLKGGLNKI